MQGCVCVVGNDVGDVLLMPLDQLLLRFDNSDVVSFIVIMILLLLSGIVCVRERVGWGGGGIRIEILIQF